MAIPPNAKQLPRAFDPADKADFEIGLGGLLQSGETIDSYTLILSAEGAALGVSILSAGDEAPTLTDNTLRFWVQIDEAFRADPAFDGAGTPISQEISIVTSLGRRFQRTVYFTVAQQ